MGGYRCIPLDPKSRTDGVPSALVRKTGPVVQKASGLRPSRHIGRGRCAAAGGRDAVAKGCHRESVTGRKPRLLCTSVHSNKEVRGLQTRVRPFSSQQVPPQGSFQDGYPGDNSQQHQTRGLCNFSRSLGCVFPCRNSSSRQEVAQIPLGGKELPVSSTAVRSEPVPMDLHSSGEISDSLAEVRESSHKCLPGRLAGAGGVSSVVCSAYQSDDGEGKVSWVPSELGQVGLGTLSEIRFSGHGVRHSCMDCGSEPRAGTGFVEQNPSSESKEDCRGQTVVFPSRDDGIDGRFVASGKSTQTAPPERGIQQILTGSGELEQDHHPRLLVPSCSPTVDSEKLDFWESPSSTTEARFCPICRCLAHGLGCPYAGGSGERQLVRKPQELAYQRPRVGGGWSCTEGSQSVITSRPHSDCLRQYDSSIIDKAPRRNTCTSSLTGSREAVVVGRPEVLVSVCSSSEGQSQCPGRSSQQERFCCSHGMDCRTRSAASCLAALGQTRGRSVCDQIQCQTPVVCLSSSRCASVGGRCDVSGLEQAERLRISSVFNAASSVEKGSRVSWTVGASCTMVADNPLVQSSNGSVACPSSSTSGEVGGFVPTTVAHSSRQCGSSQPARLAFVRQKLQLSGLSKKAIDLSLASIRSSTSLVYDNHWRQWMDWCEFNSVDPANPSEIDVANHLAFLSCDRALSAASLKVRRSAIASTLAVLGVHVLSQAQLVSNVIKATALTSPRPKVRVPDWDILVVLSFLMSHEFEPIKLVSLKQLTVKTCFLVMLASGRRASEVANLSGLSGDISEERDGSITLQFLPEFLAKNQRPGSASPAVSIKPLSGIISRAEPDFKNCPVRALKEYRRRTKMVRSSTQRALFLSFNPHMKTDIRVSSISRWLKNLIIDSYLNWGGARESHPGVLPLRKPRPHEIRAWSSSLACRTASLSHVLQAAFWRSEDVFINYYLRDVARRRENGLWGLPSIVAAQTSVPASASF